MRLTILAILGVALSAEVATAQRPSTLNMTCNEARNLVASRGAIVMSTGRYTYQRFVVSPTYCSLGEYGQRTTAPTRDNSRCPIGYYCQPGRPPWDEDGLGFIDRP